MYLECRHIMPNGTRCHAPALRGTHFCYFHTRMHRRAAEKNQNTAEPLEFPVLEDRSAIQVALAQVLNRLGSSKLDPRHAGLLLYGLQIASQNVDRNCDILPMTAVPTLTRTKDGEDLAPEKLVCFDPQDCDACPKRHICEDYCAEEEEGQEA